MTLSSMLPVSQCRAAQSGQLVCAVLSITPTVHETVGCRTTASPAWHDDRSRGELQKGMAVGCEKHGEGVLVRKWWCLVRLAILIDPLWLLGPPGGVLSCILDVRK